MSGMCKLGIHNWKDDCENCARCGKARKRPHEWSRDCEKCKRCKKENHKWEASGHRCSICKAINRGDLAKDLELALLERAAGRQVYSRPRLGLASDLDPMFSNKKDLDRIEQIFRGRLEHIAKMWDLEVDELLRVMPQK